LNSKWIAFLLVFVLLLQYIPLPIYANSDLFIEYDGQIHKYVGRLVTVEIDQEEIKTGDMPAIIVSQNDADRTLVPAREVFESQTIGAEVEWNNEKQEVYISFEDTFIKLKINSEIAYINGVEKILDVPAKLIRDTSKEYAKTMIPLRFVAEALEYEVGWDQELYKATLHKEKVEDIVEVPEVPEVEVDETPTEDPISDIADEEQLSNLDGSAAKRPLPTALALNPVIWLADQELIAQFATIYEEKPITNENLNIVNIKEIVHKKGDISSQFIIKADGPISSISKNVWEDKLSVDIVNSTWNLNAEQAYNDPFISRIRSSQFSKEPMTTRVVFDFNNKGVQHKIELSEDRKEITVTMLSNLIYSMETGQNNEGDYVKITGLNAPDTQVFRLSNPNRLIFDLPNTLSGISFQSEKVEGQYIKEIRSSQFDATTTRIVLETDGQADYQITTEGNNTFIQILEPGYKNIGYEHEQMPVITYKKPDNVKLNEIKVQDLYLQKEFVVEMPGNHLALYGNGRVEVIDGQIESVEFTLNDKGNTELRIKANKIFAYEIVEVGSNFVINIYRPKDKYSQIIVIDAGHGGRDPGAQHNGLVEKTLVLEVVHYLKEYMDSNPSIKTYYTRLDDTYPTLAERVELANEVEADMFLSVHANAFTNNPNVNGIETLYFPTTRTSGLDSIEFADILQNFLVSELKLNSRGLKQRTDLYVLKHTKMPAALVEIGFMTSPIDSAQLKKESFKRQTAYALYQSIVKTFADYPTNR
jgi:N-acetylmuramoyl-L-alanine amidase